MPERHRKTEGTWNTRIPGPYQECEAGGPEGPPRGISFSPDKLSVIERIVGVVRRPRSTFQAVAAAPRSAPLLAALFVIPFVLSAAFFASDVGQQALVDQWERTALAFGQTVDDDRYAELQQLSRWGVVYGAITAFVSGPAAAIALAALLFWGFTAVRGRVASYGQVLAVVAHAGVILILRHLVAVPMNYMSESLASPATLIRLFPGMDEASPASRFLGLLDVFIVWWLVVVAIGLAVLYRQRARTIASLLIGVYTGVALALAGAMAVLGGAG